MKSLLRLSVLTLWLTCACHPATRSGGTPASVMLTARVEGVSEGASWDHFDDGSFATYDAITFAVVSPGLLAGRLITVLVEPERLPKSSVLRSVGSRCTFGIDPASLEAETIYWGAIEELRVLGPRSDASP